MIQVLSVRLHEYAVCLLQVHVYVVYSGGSWGFHGTPFFVFVGTENL